jgi:hypothetical protein
VVVSADMTGVSSSDIRDINRKFPLDVSVDTDQPLAAMPSHSYIAVIRVQHSTSLL